MIQEKKYSKRTLEKHVHKQVCAYIRMQYPYVVFNTDMSGIYLSMQQALHTSKLRSGRGFPDIVIYFNNGYYSALFIELKIEETRIFKKNGTPATAHISEQIEMHQKLKEQGYCVKFACGFEEAKEQIDSYMSAAKRFYKEVPSNIIA